MQPKGVELVLIEPPGLGPGIFVRAPALEHAVDHQYSRPLDGRKGLQRLLTNQVTYKGAMEAKYERHRFA